IEPNFPVIGIEKADEVLDQDALPDAGGADDEEDFAGAHFEGDVVEDLLRSEGLLDVLEVNQCVLSCFACACAARLNPLRVCSPVTSTASPSPMGRSTMNVAP